jgi:NAD(P)-dependent dehydrogenase (short-subunit alcohol dehydrogenase family)
MASPRRKPKRGANTRLENRIGSHHQYRLVARFLPMPYMAVYAATKHAIEGYSESLDHELRTRGVRVLVVEPGAATSSARRAAGSFEPQRPPSTPVAE